MGSNNKVFKYPNTFQQATSITFNPWFPPETSARQGILDFYVPIINYGTTCALAFGICVLKSQLFCLNIFLCENIPMMLSCSISSDTL